MFSKIKSETFGVATLATNMHVSECRDQFSVAQLCVGICYILSRLATCSTLARIHELTKYKPCHVSHGMLTVDMVITIIIP